MSRETAALVTAAWFEDVWREVEADQALERAEAWEAAKPRPTDFAGGKTREELRDAWRRCHTIAAAYRAKAAMLNARQLPTGLPAMAERDDETSRSVAA